MPGDVAEKCQTLFKERENFGFYYINFYRLKKGKLNKFSEFNISKLTNLKKRAKPGNPEGEGWKKVRGLRKKKMQST